MTSPYSGPSPLPAGGSGADGGQGGGGGGSGSSTSRGLQPIRDVNGAYQLLKAAFEKWPNCATRFGGQASVLLWAARMTFVDGRGPGYMNRAGDPRNNMSFNQYHAQQLSTQATTLLDRFGRASMVVVLWSDFWGPSNLATGAYARKTEEQMLTLVHELIHSKFNMLQHTEIARRFGIPGWEFISDNVASQGICIGLDGVDRREGISKCH